MRVEIPNQIMVTIGGLISRGVKAVEVTDAGKLIFTLTDGSTIDLGSVMGPQGPKGETGPAGPQGQTGPAGAQGETGAAGASITSITKKSQSGTTATYTIALSDGKTFDFNVETVKGEKGDNGDKGETGATGPKGETGERGPQGETGPKGDPGEKGETGATGATGPKGDPGQTGPQGETGQTGPAGPQGQKGDTGSGFVVKGYYGSVSALQASVKNPEVGDAYGVGAAAPYDIYIYDGVTNAWVNNGPLQGAKGDKGDPGEQGPKGETGSTGPQGPQGPAGKTPVKGTDYFTQADKQEIAEDAAALVDLSGKQNKITASGILKGDGAGGVTAATPGTDYLTEAPVTSVNGATGEVKSTFYVTVTQGDDDSVTADKTAAEVYAAYEAGYAVYAVTKFPAVNVTFELPLVAAERMGDAVMLGFAALGSINEVSAPMYPTVAYGGNWLAWLGTLAKESDIPTALKNPNALNIKIGDTTTSYDGSAAKTVEIPKGVPSVSAADNGKFLRVVNGAWAAAAIDNANGGSF